MIHIESREMPIDSVYLTEHKELGFKIGNGWAYDGFAIAFYPEDMPTEAYVFRYKKRSELTQEDIKKIITEVYGERDLRYMNDPIGSLHIFHDDIFFGLPHTLECVVKLTKIIRELREDLESDGSLSPTGTMLAKRGEKVLLHAQTNDVELLEGENQGLMVCLSKEEICSDLILGIW